MGTKFSLLKQLDEAHNNPDEKSPFPKGIEYQEYLLEVEGRDQPVFIPLRECAAFEASLSSQTKYLTSDDMREILRKHRGIRLS